MLRCCDVSHSRMGGVKLGVFSRHGYASPLRVGSGVRLMEAGGANEMEHSRNELRVRRDG